MPIVVRSRLAKKPRRPVGRPPTRAPVGTADGVIEVEADVDWTDGTTTTVIGQARAWTPEAVLVEWCGPTWRIWEVWLPVGAVRPAGGEPLLDDLGPRASRSTG